MEATQIQGFWQPITAPAARSSARVLHSFPKNPIGITNIQSRHKNPAKSPPIPSLFFSPSWRLKSVRVQSSTAEQSVEVLPDKLRQIVRLFEPVTDQRAKYNQLMHYAKNLKPLPKEFQTTENKVQGCVSQVWVKADLDSEGRLYFQADSDSILTKGLAALLVEGLSGSTPEEIIRLTPDFIQMLGLKQSLTPSRSNGFYNMFKLMQTKAKQLQSGPQQTSTLDARAMEVSEDDNTPKVTEEVPRITTSIEVPSTTERADSRRSKIEKKLGEALNPTLLEVEDVSHQHAGHAGVRGVQGGETHFNLKVVSKEFEGKSLVKRHRQVYDLLQDELKSGLHALSIVAKTPSEVAGK